MSNFFSTFVQFFQLFLSKRFNFFPTSFNFLSQDYQIVMSGQFRTLAMFWITSYKIKCKHLNVDRLLLNLSHFQWKRAEKSLFSHIAYYYRVFPRFCQKNGPNSFISTAKTLVIRFNSNAKVEGEGAECSIACSDLTPTSTGTLVCKPSDQSQLQDSAPHRSTDD